MPWETLFYSYYWEYTLGVLVIGVLLGMLISATLHSLHQWVLGRGEVIHPRDLPPEIRAEVQDLDRWTNWRRPSDRS